MSDILFADEYRNEKIEFETGVSLKKLLTLTCGVALLATLFFAFKGEFLLSLVCLFEAVICVCVIKLRSYIKIRKSENFHSAKRGNTYMRIYEDRVVVKKPCQKEKVYNISPNQYTITLKHGGGRACARLVYVIADKQGKKILRYVSDTNATNYKILKQQMKYDIKKVGCRNIFDIVGIID